MNQQKDFADKVAETCCLHYANLGRKGKPQSGKEWTLMAAVVLHNTVQEGEEKEFKVVAMGTGSKCLGQSKMSATGEVVNDCHAEIVARRAFLLYLYEELQAAYSGSSSEVFLLSSTDHRCSVKPDVHFHFFTSHTPCGDASIFPKHGHTEVETRTHSLSSPTMRSMGHSSMKRKDSDDDYGQEAKYIKLDTDAAVTSNKVSENAPDAGKVLVSEHMFSPEPSKPTSQLSLRCPASSDILPSGDVDNLLCTVSSEELGFSSLHNLHRTEEQPKHVLESSHVNRTDKLHTQQLAENSSESGMISTDSKVCSSPLASESVPSHVIENTAGNQAVSDLAVDKQESKSVMSDIYRTGAKCVPGGAQDPHQAGLDYHTLGALRIKPGRGERTISMCCSDKMARWNVLGCQGALLSLFLDGPLYFDSIIIGKCPYSEIALKRAVFNRVSSFCDNDHQYKPYFPHLLQSSVEFPHSQARVEAANCGSNTDSSIVPCSASIIWHIYQESSQQEVIVNGRKQGITKKNINSPAARSNICPKLLYGRFIQLVKSIPKGRRPLAVRELGSDGELENLTYFQAKSAATDYQQAWKLLRQDQLRTWIQKSADVYYSFS